MAGQQSDRVYEDIRRRILLCLLSPGSKIRMNELTETLDVSLSAVREGLARLASDGLVVMESQKGFTVAPLSWKDLDDLTEARIEVERLCLQHAIAKGSIDWETDVLAAHHRLTRIPRVLEDERGINPDWAAAHDQFHEVMGSGCDNKVLLRIRQALYAQAERYRWWATRLEDAKPRNTAGEHKEILEALLARNEMLACELAAKHIRETTRAIKELHWDQMAA